MRDAIVSLAAGASQLALLRRARELGHAVIAVDRDPQAAGFALADERLVHSTHDADGLLPALATLSHTYLVRGVLTKSSGEPVLTAAKLARALGLPGLAPELVAAAGSKPGTLALAREAGVATARGVASVHASDEGHDALGFPRVVRPARTRVGKRGIRLVLEAKDFVAAHEQAAASSSDGCVLVEEYIEGSDVIVCGFLERDACHVLALVDEDTRFDEQHDVKGFGFRSPSRLSGTWREQELREATHRFFGQHRFGTGVFFLTFRVGPDVPVALLEAHFDLPGDQLLESFFPAAGGPDFLQLALGLATSAAPQAAARACPLPLGTTALRFVYASDLGDREETRARLEALEGCLRVDLDLDPSPAADPRVGLVLLRTQDDPLDLELQCDSILRRPRLSTHNRPQRWVA